MFNLVEFSARLRQERKAKRLNQSDFGALGGVGLQTQSRYEKGETEPSAAYLADLAHSGVDVLYILTGQRQSASLSDDVSYAAGALGRMAPNARSVFLELIKALEEAPPFPVSYYRQYDGDRLPKAVAGRELHERQLKFRGEGDQ